MILGKRERETDYERQMKVLRMIEREGVKKGRERIERIVKRERKEILR